MRPIVALLTDFGTGDYYVGALKGAVLAACREATLVDISHDVPPHAVEEGAFLLEAACRTFPGGTVFVAVVDPGVGSSRRGLALEIPGYRFVGPDNGLFSRLLRGERAARLHEITNRGLFRAEVSPTFHGRDVFAPVAGLLAGGLPIENVGPAVEDPLILPLERSRQLSEGEWEAEIVHVDRFGNLVTALPAEVIRAVLAAADGDAAGILVDAGAARLPLAHTYADVAEGEGCALLGSSGRLELAINQGSAAKELGLGRGDRVRLRALGAAGEGP